MGLLNQSLQIKEEEGAGLNTALRVGTLFEDIVTAVNSTETVWYNPAITPTTINNGSYLNILTLLNNTTHKDTISDSFDQLNIVSNGIKTTWRGSKIAQFIRVKFNISTGNDRTYQLQIRRSADDSVVYRELVERDATDPIQNKLLFTRTISETDPFVTGGFYLALMNNSGASCQITGDLQIVHVSQYQLIQKTI